MILRRVIDHFRKQEWTAIFLDFVIVVVGVFVGMQVNNWNEARTESIQERDIIAGIARDLRTDREEFRIGENSLLASISAGNYVLGAIGEPRITSLVQPARSSDDPSAYPGPTRIPETSEPDNGAKDGLWAILIAGYYPTAGVTAYDALTNTGKLGIIKDEGLIKDLQYYFQLSDGLEQTHAGTMRPLRNDAISAGHRYGLSPLTAVPEEEFLQKMRDHEELRAVLRTQIAYKTLHYGLIQELDAAATAIIAAIENEGAQR